MDVEETIKTTTKNTVDWEKEKNYAAENRPIPEPNLSQSVKITYNPLFRLARQAVCLLVLLFVCANIVFIYFVNGEVVSFAGFVPSSCRAIFSFFSLFFLFLPFSDIPDNIKT